MNRTMGLIFKSKFSSISIDHYCIDIALITKGAKQKRERDSVKCQKSLSCILKLKCSYNCRQL